MNRPISNWFIIPIIIACLAVLAYLSIRISSDIASQNYQQGYQDGYDKGYADGKAPYKSVSDNIISVDTALVILANGEATHQYYIDHPEKQNEFRGWTDFQQKKVKDYTDLENLIKWQANQLAKE